MWGRLVDAVRFLATAGFRLWMASRKHLLLFSGALLLALGWPHEAFFAFAVGCYLEVWIL
jgi:hypothetical protein